MTNKKALIIGLGTSGLAAARFLQKRGKEIAGVDSNPDKLKPLSFPVFLETDPIDYSQFDLAVLSPGIPHCNPVVSAVLKAGIKITGEAELAFASMDNQVVAITGTNGKTTVTLLVTHVLKMAGFNAVARGNVGLPLADFLPGEVIVAELSSYQLETMESKKLQAAVILNITPDHLDRYGTMDAYAEAKCLMQKCLKPGGVLYCQEKAYFEYGSKYLTENVTFLKETVDLFSSFPYKQLLGHEKENAMAAYSLCKHFGISDREFEAGYSSFKKPSHRIEFVTAKNGVSFFDDSKGTNVDATLAALNAMQSSVVLIAGGVDKGGSYEAWGTQQKNKIKTILAIGQAAGKIEAELKGMIEVQKIATLKEAVEKAALLAKPGENVLLSPGCSSFDMFRDYVDRGKQFQELVLKVCGEK